MKSDFENTEKVQSCLAPDPAGNAFRSTVQAGFVRGHMEDV